jgi:diadenosine tetraphosphate (Ap4A) HIT family hydrolase
MRGYCFLMLKRHAVELHDLSTDEAAAFVRDAQAVSRAVQEMAGAVKMNYEIHGNTVPHLHMHVFPRYPGDPFEGAPINPRLITGPVYRPGEHAEMRQRIREALARAGG